MTDSGLISLQNAEETADNPRVIDGGHAAFRHILARVESARRSIRLRAFLWRDDDAGNVMGEALLRAADRGVNVVITKDKIAATYEYFGGNGQSFFHKVKSPTQRFQAWFLGAVYGATAAENRPPKRQRRNPLAAALRKHRRVTVERGRRFDHAKMFLVDESYLILGSMGIGDNHLDEWVDIMVEVEGHDHFRRLQQRQVGKAEFDHGRRIDFLVHSHELHERGECPMAGHRLDLIDSAQSSLTIEMAYMGDRRFTEALARAVNRGVKVKLITAARADILGDLNRSTLQTLMERTGAPDNLEVVLIPRMVHTKMVVIDRQIADIGSANFTPLSHGVYEECNLYARDARFAQALEELADRHCNEGTIADAESVSYRKLHSQVERAIVAFQSRKGG